MNDQLFLIAMPAAGGETPTINVNSPSVPVKKLTDIGADDFHWADDGKTMTWALGSSFFRQPLSTVVFRSATKPDDRRCEKKEPKRPNPPPKKVAGRGNRGRTSKQPRHKPLGTVVLRGAKIITMKGEEVIPDGDIVVTDNRIAAVGKRGVSDGSRGRARSST